MKRFLIERIYLPTETLGSLYDDKRIIHAKTMEQAWRNNQKDNPDTVENDASCIPEGLYIVEKQEPNPSRPYGYFRFRAIQGRTINQNVKDKLGKPMSSILMHRITYVKDLLGCIGICGRFQDLNKDGVPDAVESSKTLERMYQTFPAVFELEIRKKSDTSESKEVNFN